MIFSGKVFSGKVFLSFKGTRLAPKGYPLKAIFPKRLSPKGYSPILLRKVKRTLETTPNLLSDTTAIPLRGTGRNPVDTTPIPRIFYRILPLHPESFTGYYPEPFTGYYVSFRETVSLKKSLSFWAEKKRKVSLLSHCKKG